MEIDIINQNLINFDPKSVFAVINFPDGINLINKVLDQSPEDIIEDLKTKQISTNHRKNIMRGLSNLQEQINKFQNNVLEDYIYKPQPDFFMPFNIETFKGKLQGLFQGHQDRIWSLVSLDNNHFASTSNDKTIKIWNIMDKNCISTLSGHEGGIYPLIKINEDIICSGSQDGTIRLWNWKEQSCLQIQKLHQSLVKCLAQFNEKIIISGGEDKKLIFWDFQKEQIVKEINNAHGGKICAIQPMRSNLIITTGEDKIIKVWNMVNYSVIKQSQEQDDEAECIQDLDHITFATGTYKAINIWTLPNLVCERTLNGHSSWILKLTKIDQHIIASASQDYSIRLWNWRLGECIKEIKDGHNDKVFTITKFGEYSILSACKDGRIYQWK